MSWRAHLVLVAATVVLLADAAVAQRIPKAQFIPLGDLPGGEWLSMAHDVSADGSVVVGQSRGELGPVAFRWHDGIIEPLHGLPDEAADPIRSPSRMGTPTIGLAQAVNADGTVIAGTATIGSPRATTQAFRYQLGTDHDWRPQFTILSRGASFSEARDLSADGSTLVGQASLGAAAGATEAFLWRGGIMRFLPPLQQGWPATAAVGISADGLVIAGTASAGTGSRAFRFEDGRSIALATLMEGGGFSEARAISADGRVIVGATQSRWGHEACRWIGGESPPQTLGGLSDHHELYSYATGVSGDGAVIVGSSENELGRHEAFVWTAIDGMRPLAELLVHDFHVDLAGWSLSEATAVADDGCSIVGFGRNPDNKFEGWLVRFDREHWPRPKTETQTLKEVRFGSYRTAVTGLAEPRAVAIDSIGTIYIAEAGARRLSLYGADGASLGETKLPQDCEPRDIALGASGVYVLDAIGRSVLVLNPEGALIQRIDLPRIGEFAMTEPAAIAVHAGRIFIVDRAADRIVEFDPKGTALKAFGGTGNGPGQLRLPSDIAIADDGSIFVADAGNHRVQKFDAQGNHQFSFGQRGSVIGFLMNPSAIALHGEHVFVADSANHRVQVFDRNAGRFAYAFGRRAMRPHVAEGTLHYPDSIAIAPSGEFLVIAEAIENRCQIFDRLDAFSARLAYTAAPPTPPRPNYGPHVDVDRDVIAVTQSDADTVELILLSSIPPQPAAIIGGYGSRPGQFIRPAGVKFDSANHRLLVTDHGTRRLQVFQLPDQLAVTTPLDPTAVQFVRSVDCRVWQSFIGTDALAVVPDAVELDGDGNVYVLDRGNRMVVVLNNLLHPTRIIGSGRELREPTDIALNGAGDLLLVCDRAGNNVVAFDVRSGEPRLSPGSQPHQFNRPWGVACDQDGFVYVSDDGNRVQKCDRAGNRVLQWGEEGLKADQMFKPRGIAAKPPDRLLLLDWGNHRAMLYSTAGEFVDAVGWPLFIRPAKLELD